MALVITIESAWELKERFIKAGRDYFSLEACEEIINQFNIDDTNYELDIIGICCDYTEETPDYIIDNYDNIEEIADARDEDGDIDTTALLDALNYHTYAVELENGNILYQNF